MTEADRDKDQVDDLETAPSYGQYRYLKDSRHNSGHGGYGYGHGYGGHDFDHQGYGYGYAGHGYHHGYHGYHGYGVEDDPEEKEADEDRGPYLADILPADVLEVLRLMKEPPSRQQRFLNFKYAMITSSRN